MLFDASWQDPPALLRWLQEIGDILGQEEVDKQLRLLENPYGPSTPNASMQNPLHRPDGTESRQPPRLPEVALAILPEWCDKILHHGKCWEIRGSPCIKHLGETVAIAQSGSQHLVGQAIIRESRRITREELAASRHLHLINNIDAVKYKKLYAWVLDDVRAYDRPIPYRHINGCVNWIPLVKQGQDQPGSRKSKRSGKSRKAKNQCRNPQCQFSLRGDGQRGSPYKPKGGDAFEHCVFCSPEALQAALGKRGGRCVHRTLARLAKVDADRHRQALLRIQEMQGPQAAARFGPKVPTRSEPTKELWRDTLNFRQAALRADEPAAAAFQAQQRRAMDRLKRKFSSVYGEDARPDETWMSKHALAFRRWCLQDSWRMCSSCGRMVPQPFRSQHAKGSAKASAQLASCGHCKSGGASGYWAPTPEDIPRRLRKLTPDIIEALRPFDIHTGETFRAPNGYLLHCDMLRFSFKTSSVQANLAQLPRKQRRRGERALHYLLQSGDSSYVHFWQLHERFLQQRARAIERGETWEGAPSKKMPANFIETVGLECALWPHLYWSTTMTETCVRSQDARRLERQRREDPNWDEDEAAVDGACRAPKSTRQSAKASFLAKAHSSLIGYNSDSLLLQFVYDLWLFTTVGGAKNSAGTGIREALSAKPYSPEVWRTYHMALVDAQRQLGWPSLFMTVAPYEWSFPYHYWLEDELAKSLSDKLHAPVAETLHIAHVLTQTVKGLLTGANEGVHGKREHVFAAAEGDGRVRYWVARLEFQDGKRKRGVFRQAQFYHGRGTVHVHILLWLEGMQNMDLPSKIRADIPGEEEPEMKDLVVASQLNWTSSGWPRREEKTQVSEPGQRIKLQHPKEAFDRHCRAYLPDVLAALHCHTDVLASDGRAMVLKYCASSPAFLEERLVRCCLTIYG